jgi:hypothetical protein
LKVAVNEEKSPIAMFNLAIMYEEIGESYKTKEIY